MRRLENLNIIRLDPDYPLNYYNLACAFAGEGDKAKMLANLSTAFQHKDHVLKGERMPDPRSDDSFQKYVHDDDFVKLMKQIGYNCRPVVRLGRKHVDSVLGNEHHA